MHAPSAQRQPAPPTRRRRCVALALCAALAFLGAHSYAAEACDAPAWDQLAAAPADADVVVLIQDPAALARSRSGLALRAALAEAGLFTDTLARWGALADHLGLTEQQAFDELLARRLMFIARRSQAPAADGTPAPPSWALVTSVSKHGEKLVRTRLRPAPRAKIAAQPILAAEHGRFLLALVDRLDAQGRPSTELIICPDEAAPLLEELVLARAAGAKGAPRDTLGTHERFPITRDLPPNQILAIIRDPTPDADEMFVAATAGPTDTGWSAQLACDAPSWRHEPGGRLLDPAALADLEQGALALVAESLPPTANGQHASRQGVWPIMLPLPGELVGLLAGRTVVRLDRAPGSPGAPLRLAIASEAPPGQRRAAAIDLAIAALIESTEEGAALDGVIAGEFPHAVRTKRLTLSTPIPFGRDVLASWALGFPPAARPGDPNAEPTWWAMCFSPGSAGADGSSDATRVMAARLASSAADQGAQLLASGMIRPRQIHDVIADEPWATWAPLRALRRIDLLRWRFVSPPRGDGPGRDGLVRGWVDIELNAAILDSPTKPGPGAP